ncbi:DUF924 family protein [uncultured Lentibacter sp.]|uniref:DUF924 family protein n=1 Tax=uncultured Lentibacter sp. TaxID=1659309 RepID=UPI002633DADD|nr:DUF924 family protein [uncultured Lentibacter sp.]MCW1954305.1 DUF924 domain-containing protein [Roseobacter sp.]
MSEQVTAAEVLAFWIDEVGPTGWYNSTEALDETIRSRFLGAWEQGAAGGLSDWLQNAEGALAYVILLDQFPRNMFRGAGQAFATDKKALCAAKCAITKGWDLKTGEPARQFFYLPLMHSECLSDQDRCIRLMKERMPETGENNLLHARAHREVIRTFGRFPYRNAALGRPNTGSEASYIQSGGYGATVKQLEAA